MAHHEHETRTRDDAATLPLPIEFEVSEPPAPPRICRATGNTAPCCAWRCHNE